MARRNTKNFIKVADYLMNSGKSQLTREEIKDPVIRSKMKHLKIDAIGLNNFNYGRPNEPKDTVVVFVNRGYFKYRRVIYDYSKMPKFYADTSIENRDYIFQRIKNRFYYSSYSPWPD